MASLKNDETGFGAVMIILAVVVLGLIAAASWLVFNKHNQATPTSAVSTSSVTPTTQEPQYLDIKELGIKVPLSSGVRDLVYVYAPSGQDTGLVGELMFSTTSLDNDAPSCTPTIEGSAFGPTTVSKGPVPDSEANSTDYGVGDLYAQANGYYLYWRRPQMDCFSTSAAVDPPQAVVNLFTTQMSLFRTALRGTVAD